MSRRCFFLLPILCTCWGCAEPGRLVITLERPSGALDPLKDARLSKFSLRITRSGQSRDQDTFRTSETELTVGSVPVSEPFDLRLAGKSATGLMLGLGQVLDVLVEGEGDTTVSVKFRKPLGYVAGSRQVQILDAAAESGTNLELSPLALSGGTDLAATPNGLLVLVVAGSSLVPLRTTDHARLKSVSLSATGNRIAVSPDSRYAVICQQGRSSVSVVDLRSIGAGQVTETSVPVQGIPARVAFGQKRDVATVLVDGIGPQGACLGAKSSSLVEVDLQQGKASAPRTLGRPAADVAQDTRDGALLVTLPCDRKLRRIQGGVTTEAVAVPAAYDVAVTDQNIVVMGRDPASASKGQAVLFDRSRGTAGQPALGSPQKKIFTMSPILVRLRSKTTTSGYIGWASEPQDFKIYDLAITSDSQRAICLVQADYASSMVFTSCQYRTKIKGSGYLLLDLTTGSVLVERFTKLAFSDCYSNCVSSEAGQPLDNTNICAAEFKRVLKKSGLMLSTQEEFEPSGVTLLFGGS